MAFVIAHNNSTELARVHLGSYNEKEQLLSKQQMFLPVRPESVIFSKRIEEPGVSRVIPPSAPKLSVCPFPSIVHAP